MLNIYSEKKWLLPGQSHEAILGPFWGVPPHDEADPARSRFDEYTKRGKEFFRLTMLPECDAALLPGAYTTKNPAAQALAREAQKYGKRVIIFFNSDSTEDIPIKNSIIFRTSFYRSTKKPNEYALPAWSEDFIEKYYNGQLQLRQKQDIPTVGYCGQLTYRIPNAQHRLKQTIKHPVETFKTMRIPNIYRNTSIREQAIKLLHSYPPLTKGRHGRGPVLSAKPRTTPTPPFQGGGIKIKTNFLIRDTFWGGALVDGKLDKDRASRARHEYVENTIESDYVLCTRGGGNFSYRLYETLSCGRIPLFIETDCVLPYENDIDWKNLCAWVDAKEIDQLPEKLLTFHASLSPEEFLERQKQCREIWEEWLSPQGFFKNLNRIVHPLSSST